MSYHYPQQPGHPQQPAYPSHQGYAQGAGTGYPQDHQQGYGQQQPQPQPFYGGGNGGYPVAQGYGVPPPPPPMQLYQHQQQPYGAPQQPYNTYPQQTQAPYPTQPYTPLPPAPPVQPSAQPWFLHTLIPSPPPAPPLTPQSLPGYNAPFDVDRVRKATKGFGTDEKVLIDVLCNLDAFQMDLLGRSFEQATGKGLRRVLEKELSGWLENGLVLCSLGPLGGDVHLLHRAMQGMGTHEDLLNEILLSRSNLEIHLLKETYHRSFSRPLITAVQGELSLKTERLFNMVLSGARDESPHVNPQAVQDDLRTLHESGQGRWGTDEITICGILCQRSDAHLAALVNGYGGMYGRSLSSVIASEFSGHMKSALLYIINRAESDGQGIQASADLLESSMAGMGTKDERLIWRVVRCHWNRSRFEAVKLAYHRTYGKTLRKRVEGETTGKYERMLVALIQ